jgi:hypothetical protein
MTLSFVHIPRMKNSKPLGTGTENVTANVDTETFANVIRLASVSGLSRSGYAAACLRLCVERGYVFGQDMKILNELLDSIRLGKARPEVPVTLVAWESTAPDALVQQTMPMAMNETPAMRSTRARAESTKKKADVSYRPKK